MLKAYAGKAMTSASSLQKWFLLLAARSNNRKLAMLAIKNWDNHHLEDYYNEMEFVTLVKWANSNSTATNALNESTKPLRLSQVQTRMIFYWIQPLKS